MGKAISRVGYLELISGCVARQEVEACDAGGAASSLEGAPLLRRWEASKVPRKCTDSVVGHKSK